MKEQMQPALDAHDRRIIAHLSEDGRASMQTLSSETGLSRSAVFNRVRRLEHSGVIRGYAARLDRSKLGLTIRAFCDVNLKQHDATFLAQFEREIGDFKEVKSCFHIAGTFDYLLEVHVKDMAVYHNFISRRLAAMDNIGTVKSSFVMSEVLDR